MDCRNYRHRAYIFICLLPFLFQHIFHENCIIPWLELHGTCPICRDTFTGPQAEGDGSQSEPMDTSSAGNVASNTLFSNLSSKCGDREQTDGS